jgi:hypothetical protein
VWENTQGAGGPQPSWQIRALSRQTGKKFIVDSSSHEGPEPNRGMFDTFALYGDELVWSYDICHGSCAHGSEAYQGSRVASMNLATRHSKILYSTRPKCSATFVAVWATTVVWHDEGKCWGRVIGSNILLENIRTHRVRQLTHNNISSEPVTNGRFVAWSQGGNRFSPGPVVLMDLTTGRTSVVSYNCAGAETTGLCRRRGIDSQADAPVMSNSLLVWGDSFNYLYARDLRTGTEYRLYASEQHYVPAANLTSPWGKEVVWDAAFLDQKHPIFGITNVP